MAKPIPMRRTFNLKGPRRKSRSKYPLFLQICIGLAFLLVFTICYAGYIFTLKDINENGVGSQFLNYGNNISSNGSQSNSFHDEGEINNNPEKVPHSLQSQELPAWIQNYISWHQEMRAKFPGKAIIEDPDAPPVLVRICLGLCGGLHDRLGQLPLDIYLANQTERVLLIKWIKPQPLESFLVPPPNGLDWVFPQGVKGWGTKCGSLNKCAKQVRAQPSIKGNIGEDRNELDLETLIASNLETLRGEKKNVKAVTFGIMAHLTEEVLEARLKALGETDMIHSTPTFGNLFRKFFQPHPNVQKEIDGVYEKYGMVPHEYSIAHCRVRHPKAYNKGVKFNGEFIANADKFGLPFEGLFKDMSVDIASRAISCAATLPGGVGSEHHPLYFMADESALVKYMTRDLSEETYVKQHPDWFSDATSSNSTAREVVSKYHVVARDQDIPNAHIDKNKGRPPEAYYATFVDLYLGINARCIAFGIGNYAMFAAKLSGTTCKIRYAYEKWGSTDSVVHKDEAQTCTLPERVQR